MFMQKYTFFTVFIHYIFILENAKKRAFCPHYSIIKGRDNCLTLYQYSF